MNRRRLLAGIAAAASGGVGGCIGGGEDDGEGGGGGDGGTPTSTPTQTGDGGGTPRLTDRAFERTGDCASSDAGFAGVTYGASLVRYEGCIGGSDGCAEAGLGSAAYDAGADRLSVVTTTERREGTGTACAQQLVYRSYEARLPFADGLPGKTVVYHDSMGEPRGGARRPEWAARRARRVRRTTAVRGRAPRRSVTVATSRDERRADRANVLP